MWLRYVRNVCLLGCILGLFLVSCGKGSAVDLSKDANLKDSVETYTMNADSAILEGFKSQLGVVVSYSDPISSFDLSSSSVDPLLSSSSGVIIPPSSIGLSSSGIPLSAGGSSLSLSSSLVVIGPSSSSVIRSSSSVIIIPVSSSIIIIPVSSSIKLSSSSVIIIPTSSSKPASSSVILSSSVVAPSSSAVAPSSSAIAVSSSSSVSAGACAAGATVLSACAAFNTTGAVCIKKLGAINGWNASNTDGRSFGVNGGALALAGGSLGNQAAVSPMPDGYSYINFTAGTHSYASCSAW